MKSELFFLDILGETFASIPNEILHSFTPKHAIPTRCKISSQKQLTSLCGVILSRMMLCHKLNINLSQLQIKKHPHGKPYVANYPSVHYNLSHSESGIMLGISNSPIGVDIEKIRPINLRIANRYFHKKEISFIQEDLEDSYERFFYLWTRKEAYLKKTGEGLSVSLSSFEIVTPNPLMHTVKYKDFFISIYGLPKLDSIKTFTLSSLFQLYQPILSKQKL